MTDLSVPIPAGYKSLVKEQQKVSQGDPLAQAESSQNMVIPIAKDLETDSRKAGKMLTKKPGDRIEAGSILAKSGGMFGSREIRSKVSGTIVKYDPENGELLIVGEGGGAGNDTGSILSPIDGEVILCDNSKVVLKTDKEAILATEGAGEESVGEALSGKDDLLEVSEIDQSVSGKILVARKFEREAISKAIGLGVLGIIGEEIEETIFENLRAKKIKTPVLKVNQETFKKLFKKHGKLMIDGVNKLIVRL